MPQLWGDLDETYSAFKLVPVDFADAGEYVIVTVETSARLRASEALVEGHIWHVWRLRDGIALECRVYGDRRAALDAVGLAE
jgi:ketosteroid isomerase-like protein